MLDQFTMTDIKIKIRTYGDKVYVNFCGLNQPEDHRQREFFTVISIDDLFKYFTVIKFAIKAILRPIFYIDINIHIDRK